MLSNTQFIENRVYDEEVEEPVPKAETEKTEQEKTREQKEADLIPKVQEAVNFGLQVLDSAFEQLDIKAGNSDSEEEETNERGDLILEPKDLYIDRPLPYLIGSQLFMEQEDVGLGDLSSEEGSVDSDRGSVVDSEEEKDEEESEDDFGNQSGDDQKTRPTLSDEEEEDDGCDLFRESEKEEEEEEEEEEDGTDTERLRGTKKDRPTSFADELAARIKGDKTSKTDDEPTITSSGEAKTKKRVKEKKEIKKVPSDDEEDDIFKPPKLTDEDFSPFGSKGGLFSGGIGLFDDDESDLFAEAPKESEEVPSPTNGGSADVFGASSLMSPKEPPKPAGPTPAKTPHPPVPGGLFDDDDDDDDDFFVASNSKPALTVKPASDLFDEDEEGDLFGEKAVPSPAAVSQPTKEAGDQKETSGKKVTQVAAENLPPGSETASKKQKGLFSDEEDSEQDLFSSAQNLNKSKTASFPTSKLTPKSPLSLFDDEDEEDNLFGTAPAKKQPSSLPKSTQEKAKPSETQKKKSTLLFSSDEEDQWHIAGPPPTPASDVQAGGDPVKTSGGQGPGAKPLKKTSLFEEEDEEDLFVVTKDSQKKSPKTSLLFEEDADSGGSLFGSPPSSAPHETTEKERSPAAGPLLFRDEEEKAAPFGAAKSAEKKAESVGKTVGETAFKMPGKGEPAATSAPAPSEDSNLFASIPPLEKEVKGRAKNVLSLFEEDDDDDEEEEEKIGEPGSSKTPQKATAKPPDPGAHFQSTGVFQDEELLFSHKLQKDNDPDVDLFASPKKPASEPRMHLPSGGGLFGDEEDDDLFSSAKSRPPKVPEKKAVMKKENFGSPLESHILSGPTHGDQREPGVRKLETSQSRIRVGGKRRPQSRAARRLAARESGEAEGANGGDGPPPPWAKEKSASAEVKPRLTRDPSRKGDWEKAQATLPPLAEDAKPAPGRGTVSSAKSPGPAVEEHLFGSGDLFAERPVSKPLGQAKAKEKSPESLVATQPGKGDEKKAFLPVLDDPGSDDDLFLSVKQKSTKKANPVPLLEDEDDIFASQKAKKGAKPVGERDLASKPQDIFEDDIFATEAIKPSHKTKEKEKALDSNLFDDNIDIFADLTVKPKDKKSKKKVESKSIFDDDMDDIFSSSSQVKTSKPKGHSAQSAAETKSESKASSTFDDPLNVFGGQ
ncbi:WASH complex subunit 2C isoform X5 [Tachyglossus aculeatus]|uniref:WASH complex subunit 2C isoform X5 n=1 Tax=Tachyglossus aculeatus TaxID=9261 RepID=UPI0018F6D23F|nr:WASH complex subunit 2C isoform X5 [Tachyglossus aculeatus]